MVGTTDCLMGICERLPKGSMCRSWYFFSMMLELRWEGLHAVLGKSVSRKDVGIWLYLTVSVGAELSFVHAHVIPKASRRGMAVICAALYSKRTECWGVCVGQCGVQRGVL